MAGARVDAVQGAPARPPVGGRQVADAVVAGNVEAGLRASNWPAYLLAEDRIADRAGGLPLLRELVLALIDEPVIFDEKGRGGALAELIFSEIAHARRLPLVIPMPRDPRLLRVCNAILADPASRRTLDDWAGGAGASVRTLARLFDEELRVGFVAWRQRVRFHNALEAIVAGEPIALVAQRNGYRSASAFSAAFRNVMGQPPSSLRSDSAQY